MPAVSLTMIVRNEEAQLPACLASCGDLFDELVIVDTGSTDRTKQVAEAARDKHRRPARVFEFAWCDDFSAARNEALRRATGDWIFWLDADDRLDPASRAELGRTLATLAEPNWIYFMPYAVSFWNRPEPEIQQAVRIFPRLPGIQWRGRVFEWLDGASHLRRVNLQAIVRHVGYDSEAAQLAKTRRNLGLLRLMREEHPEWPLLLFNIGFCEYQLGELDAAVEHLRLAVESCPGHQPEILHQAAAVVEEIRQVRPSRES